MLHFTSWTLTRVGAEPSFFTSLVTGRHFSKALWSRYTRGMQAIILNIPVMFKEWDSIFHLVAWEEMSEVLDWDRCLISEGWWRGIKVLLLMNNLTYIDQVGLDFMWPIYGASWTISWILQTSEYILYCSVGRNICIVSCFIMSLRNNSVAFTADTDSR